jgi:hypothetical protein
MKNALLILILLSSLAFGQYQKWQKFNDFATRSSGIGSVENISWKGSTDQLILAKLNLSSSTYGSDTLDFSYGLLDGQFAALEAGTHNVSGDTILLNGSTWYESNNTLSRICTFGNDTNWDFQFNFWKTGSTNMRFVSIGLGGAASRLNSDAANHLNGRYQDWQSSAHDVNGTIAQGHNQWVPDVNWGRTNNTGLQTVETETGTFTTPNGNVPVLGSDRYQFFSNNGNIIWDGKAREIQISLVGTISTTTFTTDSMKSIPQWRNGTAPTVTLNSGGYYEVSGTGVAAFEILHSIPNNFEALAAQVPYEIGAQTDNAANSYFAFSSFVAGKITMITDELDATSTWGSINVTRKEIMFGGGSAQIQNNLAPTDIRRGDLERILILVSVTNTTARLYQVRKNFVK